MYFFERDREVILYKGWNMLHNVIIQGGAQNVIPLIVHVTHFYYYKSI